MQISLRNAIIAALTVGGAIAATAANAANVVVGVPSTGTSQLLLFVNDNTAHTTYTRVLTQTVTNAASGGVFNATIATSSSTQGVINTYAGDPNFSVTTGADPHLATFITNATTAGDTLQWGVIAGAGMNLSTTPGKLVAVGTATGASADSSVYGINNGIMQSSMIGTATGGGLAKDISRLNATGTEDGASLNATLQGVIGGSASVKPNTLTFYGAGWAMGGLALGTSATLYGVTSSGPTGSSVLAYNLGTALLSADGSQFTFTGNPGGAVPLPAAVWLLGSGLLGLAGIGRRRAAKTEAA